MVLYKFYTNGVKTAAMTGRYKAEDEVVLFTRYTSKTHVKELRIRGEILR